MCIRDRYVRTIVDCIEEEQLIWYGQYKEWDKTDYQRKQMRWIPREHRKKGRAKKTRIEGIRRLMSGR